MTKKNNKTKDKETCGDHGGRTQQGQPCQRPAGLGRNTNTGKCFQHHNSNIQQLKKEFITQLENQIISFRKAAQKIGRDYSQVWRWQQNDPEFARQVQAARERQDNKRVQAVEDSLFKRLIKGEAAASETIFFLKNRRPDRWRDSPTTQVNISQTQTQEIDNKELIDLLREAYQQRKKKEQEKEKEKDEAELKVKPIR